MLDIQVCYNILCLFLFLDKHVQLYLSPLISFAEQILTAKYYKTI